MDAYSSPRPAVSGPSALHDVAELLRPTRGAGSSTVMVAPADWSLPSELPDVDVVVWGRAALAAGTGAREAAGRAASRERVLAGLRRRPPRGRIVRAMHRMDPPALRVGLRADARSVLLRGLLVELVRPAAPRRVLDAVLEAARVGTPPGQLRLGAGGTLLLAVDDARGPGVLRAAPAGAPGDPEPVAAALQAVAHDDRVPSLHSAGQTAGASWTLESRLRGTRPRGLSPGLVEQVAEFCATLPQPGGAASAEGDLDLLARQLPEHATALSALSDDLAPHLAQLPAVGRHGDLWSGNLLVDDVRLTGVLDWDAWSPAGVPGTDLLHLLATEQRLRGRTALGEVLLGRPWEERAARAALGAYWRRLDLPVPSASGRAAVGLAWWAAQLAGDLRRTPALAADARWQEFNVQRVLDAHADGRLSPS